MTRYGDQYVIDTNHLIALRHLAQAVRLVLGAPKRGSDAATGHDHLDAAIAAIEETEARLRQRDEDAHGLPFGAGT